jgi:hypothetical protein
MPVQSADGFLQTFPYFSKIGCGVVFCATLVFDECHNRVVDEIIRDVVTIRDFRRFGIRIHGSGVSLQVSDLV